MENFLNWIQTFIYDKDVRITAKAVAGYITINYIYFIIYIIKIKQNKE